MKKILCLLLCVALLSGCSLLGGTPTPTTDGDTNPTTTESIPATIDSTEAGEPSLSTETAAEETQSAAETTGAETPLPYTVSLPYEYPVYSDPGSEGYYCGVIGEDGVYTIVEESAVDCVLWGKLKSGLGWVNLSGLNAHASMTAGFAEGKILTLDHIPVCIDDSENSTYLVFRAHETLSAIAFTTLDYSNYSSTKTYAVSETHYNGETLTPDKPLIVQLVFYGDMTTYGISYTDAQGNRHCHSISVSGKDGSLIFSEYTAN